MAGGLGEALTRGWSPGFVKVHVVVRPGASDGLFGVAIPIPRVGVVARGPRRRRQGRRRPRRRWRLVAHLCGAWLIARLTRGRARRRVLWRRQRLVRERRLSCWGRPRLIRLGRGGSVSVSVGNLLFLPGRGSGIRAQERVRVGGAGGTSGQMGCLSSAPVVGARIRQRAFPDETRRTNTGEFGSVIQADALPAASWRLPAASPLRTPMRLVWPVQHNTCRHPPEPNKKRSPYTTDSSRVPTRLKTAPHSLCCYRNGIHSIRRRVKRSDISADACMNLQLYFMSPSDL